MLESEETKYHDFKLNITEVLRPSLQGMRRHGAS
jgi:hypothetical protein